MPLDRLRKAFSSVPFFREKRRRAVADTPRWPPFMQGLPHVTPDELLATQQTLIDRLRESSKLDKATFDLYILPCIYNYGRFVHLLPASQEHHHRGAGGLLRHGLEVANRASGLAYATAFASPDTVPSRKKDLEIRWRNACLLSGLCHDLGKPIADLDVTDKDGEIVWDPFDPTTLYLTDFLEKHQIENYYLRWRKGRHRNHEDSSGMIFPRIVPGTTLSWIGQHDPETRFQVYQYVTRGNASPNTNRFRDIVLKSDKGSVLEDVKQSFSAMPSGTVGFTPHRHIVEAMRHLFGSGAWKVNQVGGRVFVTDHGLFIAWSGNSGGAEVAQYLRDNQIPGITHDPDGLAADLLDIDVAEPFVSGETTLRYWRVTFAVPSDNGAIANLTINCLKIRDPEYLLDTYVAPIPAVIENFDDHAGSLDQDDECDQGDDEEQPAPAPTPAPAPAPAPTPERAKASPAHAQPSATPAQAAEAQTRPSRDDASVAAAPTRTATDDSGDPGPSPAPRPASPPAENRPNKPSTTPASKSRPASAQRARASESESAAHTQPNVISLLRAAFPTAAAASSSSRADHDYFSRRGSHAALFADIAALLRTHQQPPPWFTLANDEICLDYPDAFVACSIDTPPKASDLAATALFRPDPMRPGTVLHKNNETGRTHLRMTRQTSNSFAALVIFGPAVKSEPRRKPAPPADSPLSSSSSSSGTDAATPEPVRSSEQANPQARTPKARQPAPRDATPRPATPGNPPYRPSAAGRNLVEQLRQIHAAGGWAGDGYVEDHYVYLHPDAVRRFADSQGESEERIRELLRAHDCADVVFRDATRHGLRFPF